MTNPFVFFEGCSRSGTTLLKRMMDTHAQLAIISRIRWLPVRYENRDGLTPDGMLTPAFIEEFIRKGRIKRGKPLPVSREELESLLESVNSGRAVSYSEFISWIFDRYGQKHGKPYVGTKNAYSIATLHHLWPQAKFVHLIRDGRDVALSAINWEKAKKLAGLYGTWKDDPITTAALWWEWQTRVAREAGSRLSSDLYIEIRYEALVAQPAETLGSVCEFLGLPFDERMLRFNEGQERQEGGLSAKHAWKPPTPGLRNWRTQMAPENVERFEAIAGDLLDELGYPRGAERIRPETLEYAVKMRSVFEGRPLPERWETTAAA